MANHHHQALAELPSQTRQTKKQSTALNDTRLKDKVTLGKITRTEIFVAKTKYHEEQKGREKAQF
jgi:hypothetical protein